MDFDYSIIIIIFFFKLVILFITFISSQDPHVVTGVKIYAQIWLAKKAHQEMHLQKNSWRKNYTIFITEV